MRAEAPWRVRQEVTLATRTPSRLGGQAIPENPER